VATHRSTILFIHGMWLHAASWEAWVRYFAQSGCDAIAPGWPGEVATPSAAWSRGRCSALALVLRPS
jgi:non-heme chloroperoxidase